jgi:hypothetical protein
MPLDTYHCGHEMAGWGENSTSITVRFTNGAA